MSRVDYANLTAKVADGRVTLPQICQALDYERRRARPSLTMPTLGGTAALRTGEQTAEAQLAAMQAEALTNIAVLERVLSDHGAPLHTSPHQRACAECGSTNTGDCSMSRDGEGPHHYED